MKPHPAASVHVALQVVSGGSHCASVHEKAKVPVRNAVLEVRTEEPEATTTGVLPELVEMVCGGEVKMEDPGDTTTGVLPELVELVCDGPDAVEITVSTITLVELVTEAVLIETTYPAEEDAGICESVETAW